MAHGSTSVLEVGAVDDAAEREADAVAENIVRRLSGGQPPPGTPPADDAGGPPGDEHRQADAPVGRIRRGIARRTGVALENVSPAPSRLVRRTGAPVGAEGGPLDADTSGRIARAAGGGRPLEAPVRGPMEQAFGTTLDHVRIHRGADADRLNRSMNARAFTAGRDVFFADGQYAPASTAGKRTLAHELTHVLQNDGVARRMPAVLRRDGASNAPSGSAKESEQGPWGFGTKGRKGSDQDAIIDDVTSTPEQAARQVQRVLKAPRMLELHRFNRLMRLLGRPDVAQVGAEYAKLGKQTLQADLRSVITDSFRTVYLQSLLDHQGLATPLLRVRMALGAGGGGARSVISDPDEAMRLIYELDLDQQRTLGTIYQSELKAGLSAAAYEQVGRHVRSLRAASRDTPSGPPAAGDVRAILDDRDRELAVIVKRARSGEGTSSLGNMLSVKFTVDLDQLLSDVGDWISRARQLEQERFGSKPVVRRYVLATGPVDVPTSDGSLSVVNTAAAFLKAMSSETFMRGWNDGDRQAIKLMIASGAKAPTPATGATPATGGQPAVTEFGDVQIASRGDQALHARLQAVIGRLTHPKAIKAMATLAGEITIQNTRGANSRVERLVSDFLSFDSSVGSQLYGALLGEGVDPKNADKARELARSELLAFFSAAKVKPKEQQRIIAQLEPKLSKENVIALRRYAYKSSFESPAFSRLVAQLDADERTIVREDAELLRQIVAQYQKLFRAWTADGFLTYEEAYKIHFADVADVLGIEVSRSEQAGLGAVKASKPAAPPSDDEAATKQSEYADWAARWALHISSTMDDKKMVAFAVQVLGAVGNDGLCHVYAAMKKAHPDAAARFRSTSSLGKSLDKVIAGSVMMLDTDVVGLAIKKSQTVRLGGKADVDTIVSTFENLSADALLQHWTNLDEYHTILFDRKKALNRMNSRMAAFAKAKDAGTDVGDDDITASFGPMLDELANINQRIAAKFWLGMSATRRAQLNTGKRQVQTSEFHTISSKFMGHLAKELKSPEMKAALVDRGLMPSELATAGERVQYVGAQTKEAGMSTWHQWSALTVKGQLREESSARLGRNLRQLETVAPTGPDTEIAAARTAFAGSLKELSQRTKSFEKTARKYTNRLKTIVSLILDIVIMAATLGIGTVPVLASAVIQAAMSFAKDIVLAAVDKWAMPTESNIAADITVALIKNVLKAGADLGLGQLQGVIDQQLRLVNDLGLSGGTYAVADGSGHQLVESTAIAATSGFRDITAEHFFTQVGSEVIGAAMSTVSDKILDTATQAMTTDGTAAFAEFVKNWSWSDLYGVALAPVIGNLVGRGVSEFTSEMRAAFGVEAAKEVDVNGTSYTLIEPNQAQLGGWGRSGLDDTYTAVNKFDPSFGAEFGTGLIEKAADDTFVAWISALHNLPASELDAMVARGAQKGDVKDAKGTKDKLDDFTASAEQQAVIDQFHQFRELAGYSTDQRQLSEFTQKLYAAIAAQRQKQNLTSVPKAPPAQLRGLQRARPRRLAPMESQPPNRPPPPVPSTSSNQSPPGSSRPSTRPRRAATVG